MLMSYSYQKQLDEAVEKAVEKAVNKKADEVTMKFLKKYIRRHVDAGKDFEYIFGFTQSDPDFKDYPFETIKTLYDEIISPSKQPDETT